MKRYTTIEDLKLVSESALESSLAGFWDWNMVTNEEYMSPRFKEMFGYAEDEMENTPEAWQKIAFPEDLPAMFEAFQAHIESKGEIGFNSVVRYHHKNGNTVWVKCTGKIVEWSEEGAPLRAIGCHVDITEEKKLEMRLKKAIEERDILLKEVHHRVKNNLQLLLSLSRLKDKAGKIDTHEIEDSINSIARAYEAIYKSDRLDKVSIKNYLEQIIVPLLSDQRIVFDLTSPDIHHTIDFLIPIGLIVTELVNNSLKHAFVNTAERKIDLYVNKQGDYLNLRYCDNGIGYGTNALKSIHTNDSFGMMIIRELTEQIYGEVKFYDDQGAVTELMIHYHAAMVSHV